MAIEELIANGIRPPEVGSIADARAKQLSLAGLMQQRQLGTLELQQRQREIQDAAEQRAVRIQAFQPQTQQPQAQPQMAGGEGPDQGSGEGQATMPAAQPTGPQESPMRRYVRMLGATGNPGYDAANKALLEQEKTQAATGMDLAHTDAFKMQAKENEQKVRESKGHAIAQAINATLQAPPDQQPAVHAQGLQRLVQQGVITPEEAQAESQFPGADVLQHHLAQLTPVLEAETLRREKAEEARKAALAPSQLAESEAKAQKEQIISAQYVKMGKTKQEADQLAREESRDANTAAYQKGELRNSSARVGIAGAELGLAQKRFNATLGAGLDANGQPLSPDAIKAQAQADPRIVAMARYDVPGPSQRNQDTPMGKQTLRQILAVNPEWKADEFGQRQAQRKAFTSGKAGDNIGALNTATVHLDQLADVADGLKNGSFRPGNAAYNAVVSTFGNAAPTNFNSLKAAVSGELANALKGNATDIEIHNIEKSIQDANSPEQLKGFINTQMHVLGAKLGTYNERYQQLHKGDPWSPVLPSAKAVFDKNGVNPTAAPTTGGAKVEKWGFDSSGKLVKQ